VIDHVVFWMTDMARAKAFYDRALQPLGLKRITADDHEFAGYGVPGKGYFWIGSAKEPPTGTHVAFAASDRATVEAFYAAALAAGGRDNGAPGLRPQYQANYYGADGDLRSELRRQREIDVERRKVGQRDDRRTGVEVLAEIDLAHPQLSAERRANFLLRDDRLGLLDQRIGLAKLAGRRIDVGLRAVLPGCHGLRAQQRHRGEFRLRLVIG